MLLFFEVSKRPSRRGAGANRLARGEPVTRPLDAELRRHRRAHSPCPFSCHPLLFSITEARRLSWTLLLFFPRTLILCWKTHAWLPLRAPRPIVWVVPSQLGGSGT